MTTTITAQQMLKIKKEAYDQLRSSPFSNDGTLICLRPEIHAELSLLLMEIQYLEANLTASSEDIEFLLSDDLDEE